MEALNKMPCLVALHGQAVNCAAMARWYAKRGDWPAARRKAVQALAALNQLQALESGPRRGGM